MDGSSVPGGWRKSGLLLARWSGLATPRQHLSMLGVDRRRRIVIRSILGRTSVDVYQHEHFCQGSHCPKQFHRSNHLWILFGPALNNRLPANSLSVNPNGTGHCTAPWRNRSTKATISHRCSSVSVVAKEGMGAPSMPVSCRGSPSARPVRSPPRSPDRHASRGRRTTRTAR